MIMTNRRTIKFRIWMSHMKRYCCGGSFGLCDIYHEYSGDSYVTDGHLTDPDFAVLNDLTNVIQQWIGLVDKNGKEIYEGDIVSLQIPLNDQPILFNATIIWDYYQYAFEIHSSENTVLPIEDWFILGDEPSVDCTVIGNIFES